MTNRDIIYEKETKLLLIYLITNTEKELLNQKRAKEVLKERKNKSYFFNLALII